MPSATTLDLSLPNSRDRPFCWAMVQRRDGSRSRRGDGPN